MYATYDSMPRKVRFEWIGEAFRLFGAQWVTWVLAVFIYMAVSLAVGGSIGFFYGFERAVRAPLASPGAGTSSDPVFQIIIQIVSIVVNSFFLGGLYRMANQCVRGGLISVGDLFSGGRVFFPMLGMLVLFYLMLLAGLICLIVGIFVVIGLFWPAFAVVADEQGVGNAISRTFEAMKRDWLNSLGFAIVLGLLAIAITIVTCGLGTLVAQPITFLAAALCYRDMIGMPDVPPSSAGAPYTMQPGPGVWPPPPSSYGQPPYGSPPPGWPSNPPATSEQNPPGAPPGHSQPPDWLPQPPEQEPPPGGSTL